MIKTTFLSAAALALVFSTPAAAQSGTIASGADLDQVRESLADADIKERRDFEARLFRADTEDGQTVFMLVSPRDLGSDSEVDIDLDDLRERLEGAGFTAIQPVDDARFVIGDIDDDTSLVVMRGSDFGMATDVPATGAVGTGMDASGGMSTGGTTAPGAQPGVPGGTPDIAPSPGGNPGGPPIPVPGTTAPQ